MTCSDRPDMAIVSSASNCEARPSRRRQCRSLTALAALAWCRAAAKAQHQVQGGLLLDVVVGEGAAVLELLSGENQTLLVGGDSLLQ